MSQNYHSDDQDDDSSPLRVQPQTRTQFDHSSKSTINHNNPDQSQPHPQPQIGYISPSMSSMQNNSNDDTSSIKYDIKLKCLLIFVVLLAVVSCSAKYLAQQGLFIYRQEQGLVMKNKLKRKVEKGQEQRQGSISKDFQLTTAATHQGAIRPQDWTQKDPRKSLTEQSTTFQLQSYQKGLKSKFNSNPDPSSVKLPRSKANITYEHASRWYQFTALIQFPQNEQYTLEQYWYYQKKYNISKYKELPICVVVPSFNNSEDGRYIRNMKSILQQNYSNFHIVFIDDFSPDNTGALVEKFLLEEQKLAAKLAEQSIVDPKLLNRPSFNGFGYGNRQIKLILNKERKMAMPNLRQAAKNHCQPQQLFMIVDGDDFLVGKQVFKLYSAVMQEHKLWVMWTNFISMKKGKIGYSRAYSQEILKTNRFRNFNFGMSHLRVYYTQLFLNIKQDDLKDADGQYFHAANDVAIGFPVLEMAGKGKIAYVPEITYYYSLRTGLNNHKLRRKEQKRNQKYLRNHKKSYQKLEQLVFDKNGIESLKREQNGEKEGEIKQGDVQLDRLKGIRLNGEDLEVDQDEKDDNQDNQSQQNVDKKNKNVNQKNSKQSNKKAE